MKKFFIGRSPLTSIAGYILAMLTGIQEMGTPGSHNWQDYLLPAALALFGRLAGDDNRRPPTTPLTPALSPGDFNESNSVPDTFQRRGKQHIQQRDRNGRFTSTVPA